MSNDIPAGWVPETNPVIIKRFGKQIEELSELGEVLCRLTKITSRSIIQTLSGVDPETNVSNITSLQDEIADVYAQLDRTVTMFSLDIVKIEARREAKRKLMVYWENQLADSVADKGKDK
jgi:hypothetical protein